jgi:predicted nucleic acid-binding protein
MTATAFVDTNVLLYASSHAPDDHAKREAARRLLLRSGLGLSAQVMQEFFDAAVRKERLRMTAEEAENVLQHLDLFPILPITRELVLQAIGIKNRFRISYWDAAIVAAARQLGSKIIYSEDLSDGQDFGGVIVENPFRAPRG